jgi:outer membrane protein OmpA-like peptidoglycan-associated protein
MNMKTFLLHGRSRTALALLVVASVALGGCAQLSRTEKGAAIGAGAGAVVGAAVGKATGSGTAKGAVVGGMVGGTVGAVIGHQMDKQAKELEERMGEGVIVERVGEGIQVTFDAAILFAFDSSELSATAQQNIQRLAQSLQEYDNTVLTIAGHTDSVGSAAYNQRLSERRAEAAASFLMRQGINGHRVTTVGYGLTRPIASNATATGRAENRRVEVQIEVSQAYRDQLEREANQGR